MYLSKTTVLSNNLSLFRLKQITFVFSLLIGFLAPTAFAGPSEKDSTARLDWEEIPSALSYDIEIASDSDFDNIILKESIGPASFQWKRQKPGTYYWHVRGVDADNVPGSFSEVGVIDVILDPAKKSSEYARAKLPSRSKDLSETSRFSWNRSAFAKSYELQLSEDNDFSKSQFLETANVYADLKVPPQMRFWRVRAKSFLDNEAGPFTEALEIKAENLRTHSLAPFKPIPLQHFANAKDHPVLFSPEDNQIQVSEQLFSYDSSDVHELRIGELSIDMDSVDIFIADDSSGELVFQWPKEFMSTGKLLLKQVEGDHTLQVFPVNFKTTKNTNGILTLKSELQDSAKKALEFGPPIRFCVEKSIDKLKKVMCSPVMSCRPTAQSCPRDGKQGNGLKNEINGQSAPLSARVPVKVGEQITLDVQYPNGTSLHIESRPKTYQIKDLVQQNNLVVATGTGAMPFNSRIIERGDFNWRTAVSLEKPELYSIGENDIIFLTEFKFNQKLPLENQRAYIDASSPRSTYDDQVQLKAAFLNPDNQVSSTQLRVESLSKTDFNWIFQGEKKGDFNIARLNIGEAPNGAVGSYEVYRGDKHELDFNASAVATNANTPIFLGELNFTTWFERFLFCDRPGWCTRHWGVSLGGLGSTSVTNSTGQAVNLSGYNVDLRYRFTGGVLNHDPSLGLLLRYQEINFSGDAANLFGIGGFWHHPMKVVAGKYPKALDLKMIYYALPLQSGMTLGPSLDASVATKVFLKSNFFLEGALGYRQFNYTQSSQYHIQSGNVFMTGGAGWDF